MSIISSGHLCETWLEDSRPMVTRLPDNMDLYNVPAVREVTRGRAKGGLINYE